MNVDVKAEIAPGEGAAGFMLGQNVEAIKSTIGNLSVWSPSSVKTLSEAINETDGWLSVSLTHLSNGTRMGEILYFGRGMVELHISSSGIIFDISVFDGYQGELWESVKVGSKLSLVRQTCELMYDEGDEMHYPTEDSPISGLAFYAEEQSLAESPAQVIAGISVHDWSLNS